MWYVVQTTNGQEDTAIEKCRQAIPVEVADKIFSPSYEGMRKYQGEWHIEINKLFPGYVFIQSENADQLETYLEHLSGTVTPVQIGGGFYPIRTEEQAFLMEMLDTDINVNIKMYIFDHLRMYKFAHSSSCIIYSLKRYDFPVMFMTCA